MSIEISKHAAKRAKQRFGLKKNSLLRMAVKALANEKPNREKRKKNILCHYAHFTFLFDTSNDKRKLVTVFSSTNKTEYYESRLEKKYSKGKCVGTHFVREVY